MRLFEIGEDHIVRLNKEWIYLVPEFAAVLKADTGSKGDYRGQKKLLAIAQFTYIYFYTDFSSSIRDYVEEKKIKEALYFAGITQADITDVVKTAQAKYYQMQLDNARPLRTLKALYKGMDAMDQYFESIDFALKDKMGKLLNDPSAFVTNAGKLNKMYDEVRNFERRVEDDLKQAASGIRGPNSSLGDQEGQPKKWSEQEIIEGSIHVAEGKLDTSKSSFADILKATQAQAAQELKLKEATESKLQDYDELKEELN